MTFSNPTVTLGDTVTLDGFIVTVGDVPLGSSFFFFFLFDLGHLSVTWSDITGSLYELTFTLG